MAKSIDYKKKVVRQITFPSRLMDIAESKARVLGYTFPEYVRYVLTKDAEKDFYLGPEEYVEDPKILADIEEGIKEYREGKTKSFKNSEELVDHLSAIIDGKE